MLRHPDDVVIAVKDLTLIIDYPVRRPCTVALEADGGGSFTRAELVRKIAAAYERIYSEEERTTTLPVESIHDRSGGQSRLGQRVRVWVLVWVRGRVGSSAGESSLQSKNPQRHMFPSLALHARSKS